MEAFGKYRDDVIQISECGELVNGKTKWNKNTFLAKAAFLILVSLLMFNITVYVNSVFADSKKYVLVGLYYGSSSENEYEVEFEDGLYTAKFYERGDIKRLQDYPNARRLSANYYGGTVEITLFDDSGDEIRRFDLSEADLFMPMDENIGKFTVKKKVYRGGLLINNLKDTMNLINYIEEEKYLYGVVGGEIGHKTDIEAQKAQAVASRSYIRVKGNSHASYGFDICSTPHCQLYKGFDGESENVRRAVDETYGETVKYKGNTVAAFYSKNSGGYTSAPEDVWGGKLGYLKAVKDEYSPDFTWKKIFTKQEIEGKLLDAGKSIGSLEAIRIDERSESGAVKRITFIGNFGIAVLEKDRIRTTLGTANVKSLMFTFNGNFKGVDSSEKKTYAEKTDNFMEKSLYVATKNGLQILENDEVQAVSNYYGQIETTNLEIAGAGVRSALGIGSIEINRVEKNDNYGNTNLSQAMDLKEKLGGEDYIKASSEILITGLGYGHGVGMSQDGAIQMGKQGFTYKEILKYYYKDIIVE